VGEVTQRRDTGCGGPVQIWVGQVQHPSAAARPSGPRMTRSMGILGAVPLGLALAYCNSIPITSPQLNTAAQVNVSVPIPTAVPGGLTFAKLSAGGFTTCGITPGGAAYCWGYGPLGDGTSESSVVHVAVHGGLSFNTISVGDITTSSATCGLTTEGAAYCWGDNTFGELGNGTMTRSLVPVAVTGSLRFAAISTGGAGGGYRASGYTCAIEIGGALYCWGVATPDEEGTATWLVPVPVSGGLNFATVSTGPWTACGVATGGAAYCWGYDYVGSLGNNDSNPQLSHDPSPVPVAGGLTFATVSPGYTTTCGVSTTGAAYCWGADQLGELGNASYGVSSGVPIAVSGGLTFSSVSGGNSFNCGLTTAGAAYCWGDDEFGQLGSDTATVQQCFVTDDPLTYKACRATPVAVVGSRRFVAITTGSAHTCSLTDSGAAYCWGDVLGP
jgi:alpha-tubulin suppressor-like RCC1 family protein